MNSSLLLSITTFGYLACTFFYLAGVTFRHRFFFLLGTGSAVVTMTPAEDTAGDLEYDEDDPEFYKGDREVLDFYEQPEMGPLEEEDGD